MEHLARMFDDYVDELVGHLVRGLGSDDQETRRSTLNFIKGMIPALADDKNQVSQQRSAALLVLLAREARAPKDAVESGDFRNFVFYYAMRQFRASAG